MDITFDPKNQQLAITNAKEMSQATLGEKQSVKSEWHLYMQRRFERYLAQKQGNLPQDLAGNRASLDSDLEQPNYFPYLFSYPHLPIQPVKQVINAYLNQGAQVHQDWTSLGDHFFLSGSEPFTFKTLSLTKASSHWLQKAEPYLAAIHNASQRFQIDPALVMAVIRHESNFNPRAQSKAGARGLMQLMPATARELGVLEVFDPVQNIMGGTRYLRQMLDRYKGNLRLALAAYNAGPGNVDRYQGVPPFEETKRYVAKVLETYQQLRAV